MRCANSWGLGPCGPSGLQGGALLLFPGIGSRERSGRDPMPVLPIIPIPWTKSMGFKIVLPTFLCELPTVWVRADRSEPGQLAKIQNPPCCPNVPRATGREEKKEAMGALPPNPLENKKRFKPRPVAALREQQGGKKGKLWGLFAPKPP